MNTKELIEIEDNYFINTFTRQPIVLDHGDGVKVTDIDGNEYIDMFAGIAVNALGHNHPKLVKAIQDQAEKLIHVSSIYYNEPALIYAKKLIELTSFDRIFYANSGAEANEGAIKLAVKYTGNHFTEERLQHLQQLGMNIITNHSKQYCQKDLLMCHTII